MILSSEYIAAFLDCDGTIVINRCNSNRGYNPSYHAMVVLYSQNLSVLTSIQETLKAGKISMPKNEKCFCYRLQIQNRDEVDRTLSLVEPHLQIKRDQANLALLLNRHVADNLKVGRGKVSAELVDYREALKTEMTRLNRKDSQEYRKNWVKTVDALNQGVIPCQAVEGSSSTEGVTTRVVSPNNNPPHERPTGNGRDSLSYGIIGTGSLQ